MKKTVFNLSPMYMKSCHINRHQSSWLATLLTAVICVRVVLAGVVVAAQTMQPKVGDLEDKPTVDHAVRTLEISVRLDVRAVNVSHALQTATTTKTRSSPASLTVRRLQCWMSLIRLFECYRT